MGNYYIDVMLGICVKTRKFNKWSNISYFMLKKYLFDECFSNMQSLGGIIKCENVSIFHEFSLIPWTHLFLYYFITLPKFITLILLLYDWVVHMGFSSYEIGLEKLYSSTSIIRIGISSVIWKNSL